jgi:predicted amidohydrolase
MARLIVIVGGTMQPQESPNVRVAAAQLAPVWMDTAATIARAVDAIREVGRAGAQLVAFPEVYVPAYPYWNWIMSPFEGSSWFHRLVKQAVVVPSEHTRALCSAAADAGVYVVIGINERDAHQVGTLYNTNLVISPAGQIIGRHRKLVPTWAEKLTWAGGDGRSLRVYETEVGRLGTLACGENTNTLARFALLALGEQVHVANYPAFPFNGDYDMQSAIRLRAGAHSFEGKLFTVVASSVLTDEIVEQLADTEARRKLLDQHPNALSAVFGPDGQVMAGPLIDEEGILYADLDLDSCIELKQMHDIVGHYNRFDVFELRVHRRPLAPVAWDGDPPHVETWAIDDIQPDSHDRPASGRPDK